MAAPAPLHQDDPLWLAKRRQIGMHETLDQVFLKVISLPP
jgi:hypothetical protein